jgi:hypothetical protein
MDVPEIPSADMNSSSSLGHQVLNEERNRFPILLKFVR